MNVFGSALRADFRPGEHVIDLLVEFTPIKPANLANSCFSILEFPSSILNIPVDLVMSYAAKNSYIAAGTHPHHVVLLSGGSHEPLAWQGQMAALALPYGKPDRIGS
jgi:predicted nucleotidyltransferase